MVQVPSHASGGSRTLNAGATPNSLTSLTTSYANASNTSGGADGGASRPASSSTASRSYSKSGLLLMKAKCEANEVKGVRSVEHHPIMKEYRENYKRPTGFRMSSFHALFEDHHSINHTTGGGGGANNATTSAGGLSALDTFVSSVKS